MPAKKVLPNPFGHGLIDAYTGEVYDGITVIVGRKRNPYAKGWVMNSQESLEIVAKDKDIKWDTHRILCFICSRLDFENWIQISLQEIANELEMNKSVISRNIKILEEKGLIIRGSKLGRSYAFRLNPNFGWKGKVTNLEDYRQKEWDNDTKRSKALKAVSVASEEQTPQTSSGETAKNLTQSYPEINELSQEFDIPTEKLEKLLRYFQSIQDNPA
ncbi:winged helix-turn-helix domain-containing protein [Merismopedia glauca]|uniref:MarR family transcriptional regulator n=1 Tax=Merismopedia glauca CCAP 1448/3 TaxID=1296344 RepID=A0A2T1BY14_9CYAN|nr:winged helix-turn-helix domain-containing protein [Merismopedia glauca]PSB00909.1 MarR family transcriptional regulator [Merismopedia glauca CCAP 1448/3]